MSYVGFLISGWAVIAVLMLLLWFYQRVKRDASALDVGWAAGLGVLGIYYAVAAPGDASRRVWLGFVVGFWAFRLSSYLLRHRVMGRNEDSRYRTLRAGWGDRAQRNFFILYQAEALLCVVLSVPFLLTSFHTAVELHSLEVLGVLVWVISIVGETIADRQLTAFRFDAVNRGRTCRQGLWKYSRHPNYFFEWLVWCAYALMASPAPLGWTGWVSPAIMLFLIRKVTGIPPTEAQALASRGEDYRDYQRTTSAFVPWFPKRRHS